MQRILRAGPLALALLCAGFSGAALAEGPFSGLDSGFAARLNAGPGRGQTAVVAGSTAEISARGLAPGQSLSLRLGGAPLNEGASYTADAKGEAVVAVAIPEDAEPGNWPLVVEFANPSYSAVVPLKVSPVLPELAVDAYRLDSVTLEGGLYEVAYSEAEDSLFVTSATGRGVTSYSALVKLDPETLAVVAEATPPAAPARDDGSDPGVIGVFGVTVSDADGQVWVTNTRQNTIAVYASRDLSLIKQFAPGMVNHPRQIVVQGGKAYIGQVFEPELLVIDTKTLEEIGRIEITSSLRGEDFGIGGLALDAAGARLLVSSIATGEVAVIDLASGAVTGVYPTPSRGTVAVGFDAAANHALLPGQESDDLSIVDLASGKVIRRVSLGANPLNAVVDPASGLTFATVRLADRVVVLSAEGEIVANLPVGSRPNHLVADGKGNMFMVNKSAGQDDDKGNQVTRISPVN